jgi:tetraacyldisaccharide 4'-kinase
MKYFDEIVEKVRTDAPLPAPIAALLSAATPLTRLGMAVRRAQRPVRVAARVISYGNITAGGTGKTPAVIERVTEELEAGRRVAVLTRGYGAARQRQTVAMIGSEAADHPEVVGDEPALIGRHAPGVYVVRDADRVRGAGIAITDLGCDTLILDDGFQYLRLARDEDIVLIDATNPFGNGHLIPRGTLREPFSALRRATSLIVTRCDQATDIEGVCATLRAMCPSAPLRLTQHRPVGLWNVRSGERRDVAMLAGQQITAVSAIANPGAFWKTLEGTGARLAEKCAFTDHARIDTGRLALRGLVVTTEKDAVRQPTVPENWWALEVRLRTWPSEAPPPRQE